MNEPEILKRGKIFHKIVQENWLKTAKDGRLFNEHTIFLSDSIKKGRLDIFIDELSDYISIVEIKSTDWDKVKSKNINKLLGNHRRQVWKYIDKYLDINKVNVCAGIIYPKSPRNTDLKLKIEDYLNDYALQVVWFLD